MRKIINNMTSALISRNIYAYLGIVLSFLGLHISAQTMNSWGDLQVDGVRESSTTALFTPGRRAFDQYGSTQWALSVGESSGWVERYWPSPQRLLGAKLQIYLPAESNLRLFYDANGSWIAIPGASLAGGQNGLATLWFPSEMPKTSKILITLVGARADQARLYDVQWIENTLPKPFGKILPKSYSFNQAEYINLKPPRLWDGTVGNTWYEPLWSFPWEIFQTNSANAPTKIFPPFKGNPSTPAVIIWELDGIFDVQLLKAYCSDAWSSVAFEFWDGAKWLPQNVIKGSHDQGWQRLDLTTPVSTNRIRITFPYGWDQARSVKQLEVWGQGFEQTAAIPLVIPPPAQDGWYHFSWHAPGIDDYTLVITVKGRQSAELCGQLNGVDIKSLPASWQGEDTIYCLDVNSAQLRDDQQFLRLKPAGELKTATLEKKLRKGRISLGGHYGDGYVNPPSSPSPLPATEQSWQLGKAYELEKIRFYVNNAPSFDLKIGNEQHWTQVPLIYHGSGYWEADLKGMEADRIAVSSIVPLLFNEIQLYGSPLSDDRPAIEVWWPEKGREVSSSAQDGNSIIGWMGADSIQPLLNGYHPRQAAKLFWMPLSQMDFAPDQEGEFTVSATLGTLSCVKQWKVYWKGNRPPATLDQGIALLSTADASLTVSGSVLDKNNRCFVNDVEVPSIGGTFSVAVPLVEGYQSIDVKIWDKHKRKLLISFQKPVYRTIGQPIIQFDQPYGDLWSQSNSIIVSGRVGNGVGLSLTANGVPVILQGDAFRQAITLKEGTQVIKFALVDVSGRKTEKQLTIHRDQTAPAISIQTPTKGQYLAHPDIEFNVSGGTDPQLWWQFNQEEWETGTENIKTKTYVLSDGFYSYTVRAQDRSGNISASQAVNFCMDTTPPVAFDILANVTGWTNNNVPTIRFGTTDATSGVDHYEYAVDAGAWKSLASPFTLPTLADGIRTVSVRAIDRAGNIRISNLKLYIDTSLPPLPRNFRPVPGTDNVNLKWTGVDDGENFQTYRIERSPAWNDGVHALADKAYGDQQYRDPDLVFKQLLSYRVWAVDRAGNESPKTDWFGAQVGLESSPVSPTSDTVVEYENITLVAKPGAVPEDIIRIQVNELPLNSLGDQPVNPLVSKIYQFTTVRQTLNGTVVTNHADLLGPVTVEIIYAPSRIPADYSEADLKPFYYDDLWGKWIPIDGYQIDTGTHMLRFQTNHFSEYSIQASQAVVLTPQELRAVSFSPFATTVGPGAVNVSANGGSVSTSFTELVLPGKNGLDLTLQRTYDTGTAQSDAAPSSAEVDVDGSLPWRIADGWRLNFPSMKWNGSGLWMTDLNGNRLSFNQMPSKTTSDDGTYVKVAMENHEGSDLQALVTFKRTNHYKYFIFPDWNWIASTTYAVDSAQLFMKDGRELDFDNFGRLTSIKDSTRLNQITFEYPAVDKLNTKISITIVDSYGRTITVSRDVLSIKSIMVSGGGESTKNPIAYTVTDNKLVSASDIGGRTWSYDYRDINLTSSSRLQDPPEGYSDIPAKTIVMTALTEVSGPGIGRTKIDFATKELSYDESIIGSDTKPYTFRMTSTRPLAARTTVFQAGATNPERMSTYDFTFAYGGNRQYYTQKSVIDDGRIKTTTMYEVTPNSRVGLSQAPEALQKTVGYIVGQRDDGPETVNYVKSIEQVTTADKPVTTETQEWDTAHMRLTKRTVSKAAAIHSVTEYVYDAWGNISSQTDTSTVDARKSKTHTDRVFYISGLDLKTVAQGFTLPSSINIAEPGLTNNATGLLASSKTQIFGWRDDKVAESDSDTVTEFEAYAYTSLGQLSAKTKMLDASNWATTTYGYDATTGQVKSITAPGLSAGAGQVTNYAYDYATNPAEYRISTTQKEVDLGVGPGKDLVRSSGFRTLTGTMTWFKDTMGQVTQYSYDDLGRVTELVKPALNDGTPADFPTTAMPARPGNPKVSAVYDDTNLTSAITNELGGGSTYQFDSLGRLTTVTKDNTIISPLLTGTRETITTSLEYDGYNQVTAMHGPWSNMEIDTKRTKDSLTTTFAYDKQGRVIKTRLPGATVDKTYEYDDAHNQVTITDEMANKTRQTTDWSGRALVSEVQNGGRWIASKTYYDGAGRAIAVTDPNLNTIKIHYNTFGLQSEIEAPPRTVWENGVSKDGVTPTTTNTYYLNGSLKSQTQAMASGARTTTNTSVNGLGWVLKTQTPSASPATDATTIATSNTYDGLGRKLSESSGYISDYTGNTAKSRSWTYDAQGRVLSETNEAGAVVSYQYDKAGNRTLVVDPRQGNPDYASDFTLSLSYDQFNRLLVASLPKEDRLPATAAPQIKMAYDGRGNLISRQEVDGITTNYSYDLHNWLEKETQTNGTIAYATEHKYDASGRETKTTYPTGRIVETQYDNAGQVRFIGSNVAGWTEITYYDNGAKHTITDPLKHTTTFAYNAGNQIISTTDAKSRTRNYYYDRLGQTVQVIDPESNKRSYTYDQIGRLISETTPTGASQTYSYDAWGNVKKFVDARETTFTREFSLTNQVLSEKAINGTSEENVTYSYDEAGDLKTASNGVTTTLNMVNGVYQPNPYGLIKKVANTFGNQTLTMAYSYDKGMRTTGVTMPDDSKLAYGYNTMGELITMDSWVSGEISYDKGRVSGYQLANGINANFQYDSQDRVAKLGYGDALSTIKEYAYTYDKASNLIRKNDNTYSYDALNQLESATEHGWFQKKPEDIAPGYGENERDYEGSAVVTFTVGADTLLAFDSASKSVSCDLKATYGVNKIELVPQYKSHRVASKDITIYQKAELTDPDQPTAWVKITDWTMETNPDTGLMTIRFPHIFETRYLKITTIWDDRDENNQSVATFATFKNSAKDLIRVWTLTKLHDESYTNDGNGNRQSLNSDGIARNYAYYANAAGHNLSWIKSDGEWHYGYDANGNRVWRAKAVTSQNLIDTSKEYWEYEWDLHNRLIKVTSHKTKFAPSSDVTVSYMYDAQNFRVKRQGADGTTIYAYGRQGALAYQKNLTSGLERTMAYLGDQLIGWTERKAGLETRYYTLTDNLGSVTKVLDAGQPDANGKPIPGSAKVVWESEYLPFGNVAGANGPKQFEGIYTGKDIDPDTGLTYHWNRWRSEDGSTFISEDPARAGSNWYGYCGNNPMTFTDPTGLATITAAPGVVIDTTSETYSVDDGDGYAHMYNMDGSLFGITLGKPVTPPGTTPPTSPPPSTPKGKSAEELAQEAHARLISDLQQKQVGLVDNTQSSALASITPYGNYQYASVSSNSYSSDLQQRILGSLEVFGSIPIGILSTLHGLVNDPVDLVVQFGIQIISDIEILSNPDSSPKDRGAAYTRMALLIAGGAEGLKTSLKAGNAAAKGGTSTELAVMEKVIYPGTTKTVAGYEVAGTAGRVGETYNMNIWGLFAPGKGSVNPLALINGLKAEAAASGASRISIVGESIMAQSLQRLSAGTAAKFGLDLSRTSTGQLLLQGLVK